MRNTPNNLLMAALKSVFKTNCVASSFTVLVTLLTALSSTGEIKPPTEPNIGIWVFITLSYPPEIASAALVAMVKISRRLNSSI